MDETGFDLPPESGLEDSLWLDRPLNIKAWFTLAIGITTPTLLEERLRTPRYDVPVSAGSPYEMPATLPACFALPRQHERYFPELVRRLRLGFSGRIEGPFEVFSLTLAHAARWGAHGTASLTVPTHAGNTDRRRPIRTF